MSDTTTSLSGLAADAVQALGGHAPAWQIAEHVAAQLDADDYRDITRSGFVAMIRNALRSQDIDGIPRAVAVRGQYVQTDLLTLDEFAVVIHAYLARSDANSAVAERFDALCQIRHGVSVLTGQTSITGT